MKKMILLALVAIVFAVSTINVQAAKSFLTGSGTFVQTEEATNIQADGTACLWDIKQNEDISKVFVLWRQGTCARNSAGKMAEGRFERPYAVSAEGKFFVFFTYTSGEEEWRILQEKSSGPAEIPVEIRESIKTTEAQMRQNGETAKEMLAVIDGVDKKVEAVSKNTKDAAKEEARRDAVEACYLRVGSFNQALQTVAIQQQITGASEAQDCRVATGRIADYQVDGAENVWQVIGVGLGEQIINKKICAPKANPVSVKQIDLSTCNQNPSFDPYYATKK